MNATTRACALTAALSVFAAGCASQSTTRPIRPIDPRLHVGEMGTRTNFELQTLVASQEPRTASAERPATDDRRERKRKKSVTRPIFWTGIVLSVIGGAGTIAFGTIGVITERQLVGALYNDLDPSTTDRTFTESDLDTLETRGDTVNALAIASVIIGLVGMTMAVTSYGYDYTHCGPLAPKRRNCEAAGYDVPAAKGSEQARLSPSAEGPAPAASPQ
ncbi:MAG: hypothetical protein H6713_07690 [Myxococcales bacterium]|nr:hypothetical protein [Myxococcales bacterium]